MKEIWRSPYSSGNSIFTASTNYFMLFHYFHCQADLELEHRLWNNKSIKNIENHSMQFTVWRFSAKSRQIVDFSMTLLYTIILHNFVKHAIEWD